MNEEQQETRRLLRQLAQHDPDALTNLLDGLKPEQLAAIEQDWSIWARPEQLPPEDDWWTIWVFLAGRASGKHLDVTTPIPTLDGWKTMADMEVGDIVFDQDGLPCNVTAVHEVSHDRVCYQLTFDDQSQIVCSEEHLWVTWDQKARKAHGRSGDPLLHPQVRTTGEIAATLDASSGKNHSIEVTRPLKCPHADLPIDPYVLGVWLAEGTSRAAEVTLADADAAHVLPRLASAGAPVSGPVRRAGGASATYPIGGKAYIRDPHTGQMLPNGSLHTHLRELGVLRNKHIPLIYLRASIDQRWELLRGYMDGDGSAALANAVEVTTCTPALAPGIRELVVSLGMRTRIRESDAKINGRTVGRRWRLGWSSRIPQFTLPRKIKLDLTKAQHTRTTHRRIDTAQIVPTRPVRCITVDSPTRTYLCGETMIPTHNTKSGAELVNAWAKDHPRIALAGGSLKDVRDTMIFGDAGIVACSPKNARPIYRVARQCIEWPNGSTGFVYTSEQPERARGPAHHKLWGDEIGSWAYLDELWSNLMFGLRLGPHPQAVITTTPRPRALIRKLLERVRIENRRGVETRVRETGDVYLSRGSSYDNRANIAPAFFTEIVSQYEGTRLGRQEIYAEMLTDVIGALFDSETVEAAIVKDADPYAIGSLCRRVIVAVDPSWGAGRASDECGIVVAGIQEAAVPIDRSAVAAAVTEVGAQDIDVDALTEAVAGFQRRVRGSSLVWILADRTIRGDPAMWGKAVYRAYDDFKADTVAAETAFGAETVKLVMKQTAQALGRVELPFAKLNVSRGGKQLRAEPVVGLFQQGRVKIAGNMPELTEQCCQWIPPGTTDPETGRSVASSFSPDRLDAMVHAVNALTAGPGGQAKLVRPGSDPSQRRKREDKRMIPYLKRVM